VEYEYPMAVIRLSPVIGGTKSLIVLQAFADYVLAGYECAASHWEMLGDMHG
jgi:hypothetical protein